jgi:hypothetical protein
MGIPTIEDDLWSFLIFLYMDEEEVIIDEARQR